MRKDLPYQIIVRKSRMLTALRETKDATLDTGQGRMASLFKENDVSFNFGRRKKSTVEMSYRFADEIQSGRHENTNVRSAAWISV